MRPVITVPNVSTAKVTFCIAVRYGAEELPTTNATGELHVSPGRGHGLVTWGGRALCLLSLLGGHDHAIRILQRLSLVKGKRLEAGEETEIGDKIAVT